MDATPVTAATHKITLRPVHKVRWAAGADRIVGTTWIAQVQTRDGLKVQDCCGRPYGHQKQETATRCGLATFARLARQAARS